MIRAPTSDRGGSADCCSRFSVGASAPIGAPALHFNTATNRPPITTEYHQAVGDAPLLPLHRQK